MKSTRGLILGLVLFFAALVSLTFLSVPGSSQDDSEIIARTDKASCLSCHGEKVDQKRFETSAHGFLNCQNCHKGIDRFPHPEQAVAKKVACSDCHGGQTTDLSISIHGKDGKNPSDHPSCQSCHGNDAHLIAKATSQNASVKEAACRNCHSDVAIALAGSVHGRNHGRATIGTPPTCLACHGSNPHTIKAPSQVASQRGDATCRRCHSDTAAMLAVSAHGQVNDATGKPFSCISCHTGGPHGVNKPVSATSPHVEATCHRCHTDVTNKLDASAHGIANKSGKGTLNCLTCHSGSTHSINKTRHLTGGEKSSLCEKCHLNVAATLANSAHGPSDVPAAKRPNCISCHSAGSSHGVLLTAKMTRKEKNAGCKSCHTDIAKRFTASVHGIDSSGKAPDCLNCHGGKPHDVKVPQTQAREKQEAACISCHGNLSAEMAKSVHNRPDRVPGDHPSCLSCHGGSPHDILPPAHRSPQQLAQMCGNCHNNAERMERYGLTTGAYSSFEQSFHGRALLRFGKTNVANCTDCHGLHGIVSPTDPNSPTHPNHVAQTCEKCHPGSKMNFALSGANHLRLRIDSTPILHFEELFFMILISGSMAFLLGMVMLDLNRKVFRRDANPECGRPVAVMIAVSFIALVLGIILAFLRVPGAWGLWLVAIALLAAATMIVKFTAKNRKHHGGKQYYRLNRFQRFQHIILATTFTVLVLTGFPLHFADVTWTHALLWIFGGFDMARIVHRVAGVTMISNWIVHCGYLLYAWKAAGFSFKSWTMFPAWKDVVDLVDTITYGLGIRHEPPRFDRFQFREKFDYFADIWGTIVMGSSGIILWFPTFFGDKLPDIAFGFSYIAHSYEGLLAMMAIIVWHFYNAHFNPDLFPMNATWLTGKMSEEEMEREHPIEKARIDAGGSKAHAGDM